MRSTPTFPFSFSFYRRLLLTFRNPNIPYRHPKLNLERAAAEKQEMAVAAEAAATAAAAAWAAGRWWAAAPSESVFLPAGERLDIHRAFWEDQAGGVILLALQCFVWRQRLRVWVRRAREVTSGEAAQTTQAASDQVTQETDKTTATKNDMPVLGSAPVAGDPPPVAEPPGGGAVKAAGKAAGDARDGRAAKAVGEAVGDARDGRARRRAGAQA